MATFDNSPKNNQSALEGLEAAARPQDVDTSSVVAIQGEGYKVTFDPELPQAISDEAILDASQAAVAFQIPGLSTRLEAGSIADLGKFTDGPFSIHSDEYAVDEIGRALEETPVVEAEKTLRISGKDRESLTVSGSVTLTTAA